MSSLRDPVAVPLTFVVIVAESGCAGSAPGPARTLNVAVGIGIADGATVTAADGRATINRRRTAPTALAAMPIARAGEPNDGGRRRRAGTESGAPRRGAPSPSVGSSSSRSSELRDASAGTLTDPRTDRRA